MFQCKSIKNQEYIFIKFFFTFNRFYKKIHHVTYIIIVMFELQINLMIELLIVQLRF